MALPRGATGWSVVCDCDIPSHTHFSLKAKRGMSDVDFLLLLIKFANILVPDQDKTILLFTVKICVKRPLKINKTKVLMTTGS